MKLQFGRFGLKQDPRGGHCTMEYQGRTLIGEVMDVYRSEVRGMTHLKVRHFNGESWPLDPAAVMVDMLERDYETQTVEA